MTSIPPGEFIDPNTNRPRVKAIEKFTKNVRDLSTSLLGTFTPEDYRFRIIGDSIPYWVYEEWPEGEAVELPSAEEFIVKNDLFFYHLPIAQIHEHNFPFLFQDNRYTARCIVMHTPCRSNFWHFSVRCWDENNIDVATRYEDNPNKNLNKHDKAILATARNLIRELVVMGVPAFTEVPGEIYLRGD